MKRFEGLKMFIGLLFGYGFIEKIGFESSSVCLSVSNVRCKNLDDTAAVADNGLGIAEVGHFSTKVQYSTKVY